MANEELNGVIQQLSEIGTLVGNFADIASEMKSSIDGAISGLQKEKTGIDDAVKNITGAANKWEKNISAVSKNINETNVKLNNLTNGIKAMHEAIDEKVKSVNDLSEECVSIQDKLNTMQQFEEHINKTIETIPQNILDGVEKLFLDWVNMDIEHRVEFSKRFDEIDNRISALIQSNNDVLEKLKSH